jgi:hypothetical protein
VRSLHPEQRKALLKQQQEFVRRAFPKLKHYFAEGVEVDPEKVSPILELIKGNLEECVDLSSA